MPAELEKSEMCGLTRSGSYKILFVRRCGEVSGTIADNVFEAGHGGLILL